MFTTDAQTTVDLGIFGPGGEGSVYAIYNRTHTIGGAHVLEDLFHYPLSDVHSINNRSSIIRYFAERQLSFPFRKELFEIVEQYLAERDERTRLSAVHQSFGQKLESFVSTDTTYKNIVKGIAGLIELLRELQGFLDTEVVSGCTAYAVEKSSILQLLSMRAIAPLLKTRFRGKLPQSQLAAYDSVLRFRHYDEVRRLLQHIYYLDVYISVANVATQSGYGFAKAEYNSGTEKGATILNIQDVKHPAVPNAKGNDVKIDSDRNVVFLTGANMAGKSTFMKSVGIAVYVAHVGFPVAAKQMNFSIMDGLFSTINLPDNLGMGASHFYAEVLRVKKVAKELRMGRRLFVLFDELFRGTNVKDASEATIAVVKGFAKNTRSLFIISTHIIEAGQELKTKSDHIQYKFLPTKMQGHTPVYTYNLEEGISADRHGMVIIKNEGILAMLSRGKTAVEDEQ